MYSYITCPCKAHVHAAVLNNRNVFLFFCFFVFVFVWIFCSVVYQDGFYGADLYVSTHTGAFSTPPPDKPAFFFLFLWFGFFLNIIYLVFVFFFLVDIYIYIFKNASMLLCHCAFPWGQTEPLGFLVMAGLSLLDIFFSLPCAHRWSMDHEHICEMISRFKVFYYCRIMCIHK